MAYFSRYHEMVTPTGGVNIRIKWLFSVILTKAFYQKCTRQVYSLCVVEALFLDQNWLYGKPNLVA